MSTNTRITRSKGESDGLSLPTRTRSTRKETISRKDGGTALNTTFNTGQDQHQQMPTQMPQLLTQSPQANPVRRMETPAPMLPPGPHRPLTPCMPLSASPTSGSQSSVPLFKEDKYSSTSEEETEADAEVTLINGRNQPNRTFMHKSTTERPTSTPTITDYTTQGDPNQVSPSTPNLFMTTATEIEFLGTNYFFIPDGSDRHIHQIDNKIFHAGYLENGNNTYLLELPALEKMLNTQKFLMDEMSGQFYAVYSNSYQWMSTKPMLKQTWATGELINQLVAMKQAFAYAGLAGSTPPLVTGTQPTASTSRQPDDFLPKQPAPKMVQYQPPSFKLTRPMVHLTMNERIQVHHNYISAVSSLEHKKDLINRLKRSDTHNISAYEAEMSHHMTLHEDVLERILNILKQDDYYRTLEDWPVIDDLTAYDDIRLFPELYDTSTIIERITGEADLIERQLQQPAMYPLHTSSLTSTSTFVPRLTSTFEPISPQQVTTPNTKNQNTESSPQSSLPCGQQTPTSSTNTSDTPSQNTPPQPFVHSQPQPRTPTQTHHTLPKPHQPQDMEHSPVKTNVDPPTQPSIPDEETQRVPKSTNGSQVKHSKPQHRQQDEHLCFYCNQPGHLKRNCPEFPYCPKCRTSKPQRNGHTHETGESRDQLRRNQDLPQFSNHNNRCLHCAGDHQTRDCATTRQRQTVTTDNPASGTGTSTHSNAPNTSYYTSSQSNTQSPASHQHSQSTIHVQTPTLNINAPHFQPNLQQPPPPPLAQNNQNTNYHTNQQQIHTPPTQPFNTHLPQSFNAQVPPPYFPQYPPTNSPSANSTDSSILLALQKQ